MAFKITLYHPPKIGDRKIVVKIGFEKSIVQLGIGEWTKDNNKKEGFVMDEGGWLYPDDGIMHSDIPVPTQEEKQEFRYTFF